MQSTGTPTDQAVYFDQERPEVLALVPSDVRHVLELGCANGRLAAALKQRQPACHVTGVEAYPPAAEQARCRIDRLIHADCEQIDPRAEFQPAEFDCLIAADVLEHLRDPEALLRRLLPFLSESACVVVSLPNVRHAGVLEDAVNGRWTYQRWGILDRTHLRFFTRMEIERMFGRLGLVVEDAQTVDDPRLAEWAELGRPGSVNFGALTVDDLASDEVREFFVVQWLMRLRRTTRMLPVLSEASEAQAAAPAFAVRPSALACTRSELARANALLTQEHDFAERLQRDVVRQSRDLDDLRRQLAEYDAEIISRQAEYRALEVMYTDAAARREAAQATLSAVVNSRSWRLTAPLRGPRMIRDARRAAAWLKRRASRLLPAVAPPAEVAQVAIPAQPLTFRLVPLRETTERDQTPTHEGRRLICLTHVLPYPSRAGNEYRIHRMLGWLSRQGWDVLLLVSPLYAEPITRDMLLETASQYPNLVVCDRDGTLQYQLRDGDAMLHALDGHQPRAFASVLGERENGPDDRTQVLNLLRTFCPDVLAEVLLHLQEQFDPEVLLAPYVFMTRPFPLMPPDMVKVIDTIDVFSTKHSKVQRFGIADQLSISPEIETELLNRSDIVIAIQADEADNLRRLAPDRRVISVGVDFPTVPYSASPPTAPVVLLVGSSNPMNLKGLGDFLQFAWPLVRRQVPDAELHVVGDVGIAADPSLPGVFVKGRIEQLDEAYAAARVVVNPTIAGTGLKIKTVEALSHRRPVVLWPSGVDGLQPDVRAVCRVANNWFEFANHVIDMLGVDGADGTLAEAAARVAGLFEAETVYRELDAALAARKRVAV